MSPPCARWAVALSGRLCSNGRQRKAVTMPKRIALFGGTFDPIHHGHLIAARSVAEFFHFEKVTLIPAAVSPHKLVGRGGRTGAGPRDLTAGEHRLEMVRLAVEGEGLFEVSDVELRRPQPSYTFDTLMAYRQEHGLEVELCWVIGADMLEDLPAWHRADEVVDMARIITASRPPHSRRVQSMLEKLRLRFSPEQVSRLAGGLVETPLIDITSTQVRRRVREGKAISFLTPAPVWCYIAEHGLYGRPGD